MTDIQAALVTARAAMHAVIGPTPIDAIEQVPGGASGASPFRVSARDRRYLVRVEGPASPLRNPRQYESMRIAAGAGIAPRLYHVDEERRVAVMDFIDEQPINVFPGGLRELANSVGNLVARVHEAPLFPPFVRYQGIVTRLWAHVCATGLFAPGLLTPYTERLDQVCADYVRVPVRSVSSHNDPTPRNILFDGNRLWLVDWESAYRNDPLVDVGIALDNFALSPDLEAILLEAWSGRTREEACRVRLSLVRTLVRLYYAGVLLSASFARSGALADRNLSAPTLPEFREAIRSGRLQPGTSATVHVLGKMYLASFLNGVAPPPLDARILELL